MLKHLASVLIICISLSSCRTIQLAESKKGITDLAVEWSNYGKVNYNFKPVMDSVFQSVIDRFNRENHSFKLHRKTAADTEHIRFNLWQGKLTKPGTVVTSYAVSAVGLFATPKIVYELSDQEAVAAFIWIPIDRISYNVYLSPTLADSKLTSRMAFNYENYCWFQRSDKRLNKLCTRAQSMIYKIFMLLERQKTRVK